MTGEAGRAGPAPHGFAQSFVFQICLDLESFQPHNNSRITMQEHEAGAGARPMPRPVRGRDTHELACAARGSVSSVLPDGIQVEIIPLSGHALLEDGPSGRCVYFDDKTRYNIEITNNTLIRKRIAVELKIDGVSALLNPKLVGAKRIISGFEDERNTTESLHEGLRRYEINTMSRQFVARKPKARHVVSSNDCIGEIEFAFFAVRWFDVKEGRRDRDHRAADQDHDVQGAAKHGVLQTVGGDPQRTKGLHQDSGSRKPVKDATRPLGIYTITIMDRQSRTLGAFFGLDRR
jgi:hypothetical protein